MEKITQDRLNLIKELVSSSVRLDGMISRNLGTEPSVLSKAVTPDVTEELFRATSNIVELSSSFKGGSNE